MGSDLDLIISLEKSTYRDQEAISCTLALTNMGGEALVLNTRMLVNLRFAQGEVYFSIRDGDGKAYVYGCTVLPRPVSPSDFVVVRPGDEIVKDYNLREMYGLPQGQVFTAQAVYRNQFPHETADRRDGAWLGEIESNLVEFYTE